MKCLADKLTPGADTTSCNDALPQRPAIAFGAAMSRKADQCPVVPLTILIALLTGCSSDSAPQEAGQTTPATTDATAIIDSPAVSVSDGGTSVTEGVYLGSIKSEITGETRLLTGFADGWGWTRLITLEGQYSGVTPGVLTGVAAAGHTWVDGSTVSEFQFERFGITFDGTYSGANDEGEWSLTLQAQNESLPINGIYVLLDELENIEATFQITNRRLLYGSNTDGCIFNAALIHDGWNFSYVYDVTLTVENCPADEQKNLDGEYFGLAGYTRWASGTNGAGANRLLVIGVDNGERAIMLALEQL